MTDRAMLIAAARAEDTTGVLLALGESTDTFEVLCHLASESGNADAYFDALAESHPERPWLIDSLRNRTRGLQSILTRRSNA